MAEYLTKYGYAPDQEAMGRALELIASNLENVASEQNSGSTHEASNATQGQNNEGKENRENRHNRNFRQSRHNDRRRVGGYGKRANNGDNTQHAGSKPEGANNKPTPKQE